MSGLSRLVAGQQDAADCLSFLACARRGEATIASLDSEDLMCLFEMPPRSGTKYSFVGICFALLVIACLCLFRQSLLQARSANT